MQQFVDSFYEGAAQFPDRVFAIDPDGREWTYAEMARVADGSPPASSRPASSPARGSRS
ncbi:hypothetical protein [Pimelobacter simplex]|uniref:hypothetical protein n=1 Tax=Nocardioides simplex TaxID=2045 RepID=UPI0020B16249|nr:hypothetical protein [Pimelobacter simplex]